MDYLVEENPPINTIQLYYNINLGNAQDFGDLLHARHGKSSNIIIKLEVYFWWNSEQENTIDYVTIATTGNAKILVILIVQWIIKQTGCSDGHGGLG